MDPNSLITCDRLDLIKSAAACKALEMEFIDAYRRIFRNTNASLCEAIDLADQIEHDNKRTYLWLTINPASDSFTDTQFRDFISFIHNSLPGYAWFKSGRGVFECRAKTEEEFNLPTRPKGIHVHLLIERANMREPSTVANALFRGKCGKFVGTPRHIQCSSITRTQANQIYDNYLTGNHPNKSPYDTQMRELFNLPPTIDYPKNEK